MASDCLTHLMTELFYYHQLDEYVYTRKRFK